jgi:hypothetical protein
VFAEQASRISLSYTEEGQDVAFLAAFFAFIRLIFSGTVLCTAENAKFEAR